MNGDRPPNSGRAHPVVNLFSRLIVPYDSQSRTPGIAKIFTSQGQPSENCPVTAEVCAECRLNSLILYYGTNIANLYRG